MNSEKFYGRIFLLAAILTLALTFYCLNVTERRLATTQTSLHQLNEQLTYAEHKRDQAYNLIETIFRVKSVGDLTYWSTPVSVSAYTARAEECDATPWTTADGTPSRIGVVAVSPDMLEEMGLKYGEVVLLVDHEETLGVFQIRDTMARRFKRTVDILHGNVEAARLFGRRHNVMLFKVLDKGA